MRQPATQPRAILTFFLFLRLSPRNQERYTHYRRFHGQYRRSTIKLAVNKPDDERTTTKRPPFRRVSHEATFVGTVLDMEKSEAFRNEGTNPVLSDPQR